MGVTYKKTTRGEMAVLPRAEYESLLARAEEAEEDTGTARLVEQGRREVAVGAPLIPLMVVRRLTDGENPIKVLRVWRGLTQSTLAEAAGIKQNYLSDIERGARKGTAAVQRAIATALGVPRDLLDHPDM